MTQQTKQVDNITFSINYPEKDTIILELSTSQNSNILTNIVSAILDEFPKNLPTQSRDKNEQKSHKNYLDL